MTGPGKVYLVGAGPGDPGLITVKGLRLLKEADVVVYDRLVDTRLLEHARADAEMINVGKGRDNHSFTQDEINALLVEHGSAGKHVTRLKGGDPFVFGRGGEEALELVAEGIPFEIVPGITSAIGALAYAGIPITHRKVAASFAVVTGSEDPSRPNSGVDWPALAHVDTLVVLMGMEALPNVVNAVLAEGKPSDTPVALVRWGTRPDQETVSGDLTNIVERVKAAGLQAPVVTVIGPVAALREKLQWFDTGPLFGQRVLVTRTRQQASVLSAMLTQRGAMPIELPTITVEPLEVGAAMDKALDGLSDYRWTVFTSANAVSIFFERLAARGLDARALGAVKVCAIGPGTSKTLGEHGIIADYLSDEAVAESLLDGLRDRLQPGDRVLLPRANAGRATLVDGLQEAGAVVDDVHLYRSVPAENIAARAREVFAEGVDTITFASSSTVKNLMDALGGDVETLNRCVVACIGPVTAETARGLGIRVDIEATEHTVPGLVEALEGFYAREKLGAVSVAGESNAR
jgi:uroporphyrinogen III methyltransferase/synthase